MEDKKIRMQQKIFFTSNRVKRMLQQLSVCKVRTPMRAPSNISVKLMLAISGLMLLTTGAACSNDAGNTTSVGVDGGVFRSTDRGNTWSQKVYVRDLENGAKETIDSLAIRSLWFDPQDSKTIYATSAKGLWLTVNEGESWARLATQSIDSLGIDHVTRGTLYIAVGQRILKTTDAGQHWPTVYLESRSGVTIKTITVDPHNHQKIWAGNSAGEVLVSTDEGLSWKVVRSVGNAVTQIVRDPNAPQTIMVGTSGKGIVRSLDGGVTWENILVAYNKKDTGSRDAKNRPVLAPRVGVESFVKLIPDQSRPRKWYFVSKYGILRSEDNGSTWEDVTLLTTPGSVPIFDLKINPKNSAEFYYTTNSLLYRTEDNGLTWRTVPVPSKRRLVSLLIDPRDTTTLYIGTEPPPEQPKKKKTPFF